MPFFRLNFPLVLLPLPLGRPVYLRKCKKQCLNESYITMKLYHQQIGEVEVRRRHVREAITEHYAHGHLILREDKTDLSLIICR